MRANIFILTSSGGGGLLTAAEAKKEELSVHPEVRIIIRDMLRDWSWKRAGRWGIRRWDQAQQAGNVAVLERLMRYQWIGDIIIWPRVFYLALKLFIKEDIDRIIDTQPLGTSAILAALRVYNRISKKNVKLEKVIVDLPTRWNTHFLKPIRKLSAKRRKLLQLVSIPPLLEEEKTNAEFWRRYCNHRDEDVIYEYFPIRPAFRPYFQRPKAYLEPYTLSARMGGEEEWDLLQRSLSRSALQISREEDGTVYFPIPAGDWVGTILLGSQPASKATQRYVERCIHAARTSQRPMHLFVLCGRYEPKTDSLLSKVVRLVESIPDYPRHLSVIPLAFQSQETIASLFYRSNLTCTRSGGQTAMELMCTLPEQMWVHSEAKGSAKKPPSADDLFRGIPGWEAGSAVYLERMYGAKLVTPETCQFPSESCIVV